MLLAFWFKFKLCMLSKFKFWLSKLFVAWSELAKSCWIKSLDSKLSLLNSSPKFLFKLLEEWLKFRELLLICWNCCCCLGHIGNWELLLNALFLINQMNQFKLVLNNQKYPLTYYHQSYFASRFVLIYWLIYRYS